MSSFTLLHLSVLCLFTVIGVLVVTTRDAQNDQTVFSLYALGIVSLGFNTDGLATAWLTEHAMTIARTESFALGVTLIAPYWLMLVASLVFCACLTVILVQEALLRVWRLVRPTRRTAP